jgi:hypothetical protein
MEATLAMMRAPSSPKRQKALASTVRATAWSMALHTLDLRPGENWPHGRRAPRRRRSTIPTTVWRQNAVDLPGIWQNVLPIGYSSESASVCSTSAEALREVKSQRLVANSYLGKEKPVKDAQTTEISAAFPEAGELSLRIRVGACRLKITPGKGEAWVAGAYRDPSGALPCKVASRGGELDISQEASWADVPAGLGRFPATLELALGAARPYSLTIETGASEADMDLGGMPLNRLVIRQGAGKMTVSFSTPNPVAMSALSFSGGASGIEMSNLANARFAEMRVEGGAASYVFDFGGQLRQNSMVRITVAMASVEVRLPKATAARVTTESVLGGVDVGDGFTRKEGAFQNAAALAGASALLSIHANVTMGSLRLRQG